MAIAGLSPEMSKLNRFPIADAEANWPREDCLKPIIAAVNRQALEIVRKMDKPSALYAGSFEYDVIRMFARDYYTGFGLQGQHEQFMGLDLFHVRENNHLRVV